MTRTAYYIETSTDPFHNLAAERFLMESVPAGECRLYLWQNKRTVVIGRNQNCWAECRIGALERSGGKLARRLSGGGAVFHDLGNLNFTFVADAKTYDLAKQLDVIIAALRGLGISAANNGRNDILVSGRKISGNAFYSSGGRKYHHGTLLVAVDMEEMLRFLHVSADKLAGKGVSSVKARVLNLQEAKPDLTIPQLCEALVSAFGSIYGSKPRLLEAGDFNAQAIADYEKFFSSDAWRFGRRIPFTWETKKRFAWGDFTLQCQINGGIVQDAAVYSDALEWDVLQQAADCFKGCSFNSTALAQAARTLGDARIAADLSGYLQTVDI